MLLDEGNKSVGKHQLHNTVTEATSAIMITITDKLQSRKLNQNPSNALNVISLDLTQFTVFSRTTI